jgi:hypothetical protein
LFFGQFPRRAASAAVDFRRAGELKSPEILRHNGVSFNRRYVTEQLQNNLGTAQPPGVSTLSLPKFSREMRTEFLLPRSGF